MTSFKRTFLKHTLTLTAVSLSAVLGMGVASAQSGLDDVMKAKEIKIGIPTDFPPYGFVGTDLKPQGLDIDMGLYIGQKLGVKVELVPVSSANRIAYLQTKKADLVIFDSPNLDFIVYHFGINHVDKVIKKGKVVVEQGIIL